MYNLLDDIKNHFEALLKIQPATSNAERITLLQIAAATVAAKNQADTISWVARSIEMGAARMG